ncbi:MAG: deoxyribodipyrimidine photolyase [Phycisphaerae bacterium]|nr:deoxyribodipyrimidine photolyase [Phycisphaerae bacterium]
MKTLVWFRNDLRTIDNPSLKAAMDAGSNGCIAVFFITPRQWKLHNWGSPKACFQLDCLTALKDELESLGVPLLTRSVQIQEDVPTLVHSCARQYGCQQVHANRDCGIDETRRDETTAGHLATDNIEFTLHDGNSIIPVHEIRSGKGTPYGVFAPFSKAWKKTILERGFPESTKPMPQADIGIRPCSIPDQSSDFPDWSGRGLWSGGEREGLRRLDTFIRNHAGNYSRDRDTPSIAGTSTLSPWLSSGALSAATCLNALIASHGPEFDTWPAGPSTWLNELIWREFYRHVMLGFPQVSMNKPMQPWTELVPWESNPAPLDAWTSGETGIDIVDAGIHQLLQTGWMHNRVRMITAMFLTKNLLVDWRAGERFFANHLVDYDFASNNGGWQWAASTGTDAAPYFRIFNPQRQAETWDPDQTYIRKWLPRTPGSIKPIVDLKQSRQQAIDTFKNARETFEGTADEDGRLVAANGSRNS